MNSNLECPTEFFIFCSQYHLMTVHHLRCSKKFRSSAFSCCLENEEFLKKYIDGSANYFPFVPAKLDCDEISPYCITAMNDYRVEYDAEVFRKNGYSLYPSRLSALYAFGDFDTCQQVANKYSWDISTVKKFSLLDHPWVRVIRVNMEIVSLARMLYKNSIRENDLSKIWNHYWNGKGNFLIELPNEKNSLTTIESGEIFEYLIEGVVKLIE